MRDAFNEWMKKPAAEREADFFMVGVVACLVAVLLTSTWMMAHG